MSARLPIGEEEILETIRMVQTESLDIRTVTMGINLGSCSHPDPAMLGENIYRKITGVASKLAPVTREIESEFGIPIVNKRVSVTPLALVAGSCRAEDFAPLAEQLDRAATDLGLDFIGGFSALVHKGFSNSARALIESLPEALSRTERVCASVNVASTRSGINMDAVRQMGETIRQCAQRTANRDGLACCKLVVFANAPEDNPFMAGAMHGVGEPEVTINVGVSGPGVVRSALERLDRGASLGEVAETIKKTAFKVTRMGELVGNEVARRLGVPFGIVDLSLAPAPQLGDSVADILERMGLERTGAHGTTAALALLVDAVKKGGAFASSSVGGLSGGFIPVSEDEGMIRAVQAGALSLAKLEAMTAVCSVGLDMIAIPGDTPASTIAALIADEMAIGVINNKTTGVRLIPVPGKGPGDVAEFGGLLGTAPIMSVNSCDSSGFVARGGRIPAPMRALTN